MMKTTVVLEDQSQKLSKCGSGASCDGERPSIECRIIAEETGLNKNAVHSIITEHLHM